MQRRKRFSPGDIRGQLGQIRVCTRVDSLFVRVDSLRGPVDSLFSGVDSLFFPGGFEVRSGRFAVCSGEVHSIPCSPGPHKRFGKDVAESEPVITNTVQTPRTRDDCHCIYLWR
jgi:hypothetical protein